MIEKWKTQSQLELGKYRIFNLNSLEREHPKSGKTSNFFVLDSPFWVNIIPLTINNNVVLVKQYRHGIDDVTLEIPAGLVDPNELPLDAAERECLEETGYSGTGQAVLLGENLPNPAFINNKCYSFVWFDCKKKFEQKLDTNEVIDIVEVPLAQIGQLIEQKEIQHSLVLTAFFFYSLKYGLKF